MSDSNHVRVWAEQALRLQEELLEKEREQARRDALKWAAEKVRDECCEDCSHEWHVRLVKLADEIERGEP